MAEMKSRDLQKLRGTVEVQPGCLLSCCLSVWLSVWLCGREGAIGSLRVIDSPMYRVLLTVPILYTPYTPALSCPVLWCRASAHDMCHAAPRHGHQGPCQGFAPSHPGQLWFRWARCPQVGKDTTGEPHDPPCMSLRMTPPVSPLHVPPRTPQAGPRTRPAR